MDGREMHYSMRIQWDPQDNIYIVTVPELPGCMTHGATYEEAVRQGQEAIDTWVMGEDPATLPEPAYYTSKGKPGGVAASAPEAANNVSAQ